MERITPDSTEQLTTFVLTKGTIIGQADWPSSIHWSATPGARLHDDADPRPTMCVIHHEALRSPVKVIIDDIKDRMKETSKDLSVEEVQRIKDLVAKVGSLEFSILANSSDDSIAIDENIALFLKGDPEVTAELKLARSVACRLRGARTSRHGSQIQEV